MEQFLYKPLFPHVCRLIEVRTRFRLWTVDQNTPIYRFNKDPDEEHAQLTVGLRNLEGHNPITRLFEEDERWDYIGERKANPNVMNNRLRQCFKICEASGLDITNGVSPKAFFRKMKSEISAVAKVLDNNSGSVSPITDYEWIKQFRALQKYLFQNVGDGSSIYGISNAITGCDYDITQSLTMAVIDLIQADDVTFTADERNRVVPLIFMITGLGISYVNAGIPVFTLNVDRSVQMQKQCVKLFPTLIGCFTSYSNKYFKDAITETRARLGEELVAAKGSDLYLYLPKPVFELIISLKISVDLVGKPKNLDKITTIQWYQLGAPLGFFNAYTREFDAEGRAMWICCPEEFVEMYRRSPKWKVEGQIKNEILNQATYISVRGINEVGDVPDYTD